MARVELWLLRHGDAEDENPEAPGEDAARRLTPKGEEQAAAAARALRALDRGFLRVLCSPRVRARETAAPVAAALGRPLEEHAPLAGGFGVGETAAVLRALPEPGRVLLVGHEPDLSELVEALTGARVAMRKGGLAAVRLEGDGHAELVALLRPGELAAIAG